MEESREERRELKEEFLALRLSDSLINLSCMCCFLPIQWKWIDISRVCWSWVSFCTGRNKGAAVQTTHEKMCWFYLFICLLTRQMPSALLYNSKMKNFLSPPIFCFKVPQNASVMKFFFKIISKKWHNHISLWKVRDNIAQDLLCLLVGYTEDT